MKYTLLAIKFVYNENKTSTNGQIDKVIWQNDSRRRSTFTRIHSGMLGEIDLSVSPAMLMPLMVVILCARAETNERQLPRSQEQRRTSGDEPSQFARSPSLSPVARMRRYSAHGVFKSARSRDQHPAALCVTCRSLMRRGRSHIRREKCFGA